MITVTITGPKHERGPITEMVYQAAAGSRYVVVKAKPNANDVQPPDGCQVLVQERD